MRAQPTIVHSDRSHRLVCNAAANAEYRTKAPKDINVLVVGPTGYIGKYVVKVNIHCPLPCISMYDCPPYACTFIIPEHIEGCHIVYCSSFPGNIQSRILRYLNSILHASDACSTGAYPARVQSDCFQQGEGRDQGENGEGGRGQGRTAFHGVYLKNVGLCHHRLHRILLSTNRSSAEQPFALETSSTLTLSATSPSRRRWMSWSHVLLAAPVRAGGLEGSFIPL